MVLLILALALTACGQDELCKGPVAADDSRPDILVIGDSISIGWTPFVQQALGANYDVIHNPCNGGSSQNGVKHIQYWLSLRPHWYAIVYNHGIWDLTRGRGITGSIYRHYLTLETESIMDATSRPLFVLTTSVPIHEPLRSRNSVPAYNNIALSVLNGIPYVDNYSLSLTIEHLHTHPAEQNNVHWTPAGSAILADNILDALDSIYNIH